MRIIIIRRNERTQEKKQGRKKIERREHRGNREDTNKLRKGKILHVDN